LYEQITIFGAIALIIKTNRNSSICC